MLASWDITRSGFRWLFDEGRMSVWLVEWPALKPNRKAELLLYEGLPDADESNELLFER